MDREEYRRRNKKRGEEERVGEGCEDSKEVGGR